MLPKCHLLREALVLPAVALVAALMAASLPAQPLGWVQRPFQSARTSAASAYDSTRQRAVVFGGIIDVNATPSHETWEWDGTRWTLHEPAVRPAFTWGTPMAYDPLRQRTVLYQPASRQTWEWDGHEWVRHSPPNDPGPNAILAPMTFDESSQRILLFHHRTAVLWAWDGVDWTAVSSSGPPARESVMFFYPGRQRTTLLNAAGETWEWDGSVWTARHVSGMPSGGWALWYDEVRGRVVRFSGAFIQSYSPSPDMYEWDGSQWTRIGLELVPPRTTR